MLFTVKVHLCTTGFIMKSLKSPTVHNFPQKSRPLKPITVLFLQSVSLWVGNCFYSFITFKALAYLDGADRILPLACSGCELMEKETIELPWRFHGERSSCTHIISKTLVLSSHSFVRLLHRAFPFSFLFFFFSLTSLQMFQQSWWLYCIPEKFSWGHFKMVFTLH